MAKKKGTRKGAARARKKSAVRRSTRKTASRSRQDPRQVNLRPLTKILTAELRRLERYDLTPEVENTIKLLTDTKMSLTNACISARLPMVIDL